MSPLPGSESTSSMTLRGCLSRALLLAACALTAGCSMQNFRGFDQGSTAATPGPRLTGKVHGGQQPVSGATVQLWQVGTTGYGAGATALGSPAVSAADGSFSITGNYSCANGAGGGSTLVYITATGGNPGLAYGTTNSALAMMTGLGACENLTSSTFISINEVTTVASVYALSQFMNASGAVGSYGTSNQGLANAFASIGSLVDTTGGGARATTPAGNGIVPAAELNTLADILAPCINSSGPSSAPCAKLFGTVAAGSGGAPATTLGALLSIALNPGYNVSALLQLQTPASPFQPTVSSANDLTIAIAYNAGGSNPASLAIDAAGRVWISDYGAGGTSSSISLLSATGTPGANSPYQNAAINGAGSLAGDLNGNVWLVNRDANSALQLAAKGTNPSISIAAGPFSGLNAPSSVAVDASSNVWITNKGNNSLTELFGSSYSSTAGIYSGLGLSSPASLAFDDAGYAWVGNPGSASVLRLVTAASPIAVKTYASSGAHPAAVAIDAASNIWVTDSAASSVTELNSNGTAVSPAAGYTGGGLTSSSANAIDGVGTLWVADASGNALTVISASGTAVSPSGGYKGGSLSSPSAIAIDGSGNVWLANGSPAVSNGSSLGLTEFIGVASPVITPLAVAAKQRQLGQRPGTPANTTTADAGGPYSGQPGTAIAFDGSQSTAPAGQTLTYAWGFGDGTVGTGVNPTHSYSAAGTFTASLTVTSTNGVMSTAATTVTIGVFSARDHKLYAVLRAHRHGGHGDGQQPGAANRPGDYRHARPAGWRDSAGAGYLGFFDDVAVLDPGWRGDWPHRCDGGAQQHVLGHSTYGDDFLELRAHDQPGQCHAAAGLVDRSCGRAQQRELVHRPRLAVAGGPARRDFGELPAGKHYGRANLRAHPDRACRPDRRRGAADGHGVVFDRRAGVQPERRRDPERAGRDDQLPGPYGGGRQRRNASGRHHRRLYRQG